MDDVIEVLRQAKPSDKDSRGLWLAAMRMLRLAFEHDQDGQSLSPLSSSRSVPSYTHFNSSVLGY